MDNFLRQLLDMVSSIPAPGREPAMPQTIPANSPGASVQGLREVQPGPQDFVPSETRGQYSDRQQAAGMLRDTGTQPIQDDPVGNAIVGAAPGAAASAGRGAVAAARGAMPVQQAPEELQVLLPRLAQLLKEKGYDASRALVRGPARNYVHVDPDAGLETAEGWAPRLVDLAKTGSRWVQEEGADAVSAASKEAATGVGKAVSAEGHDMEALGELLKALTKKGK